MNKLTFMKYFLAFFLFYSVLLLIFNIIILGKSWGSIDYILNVFNAVLFSGIIAIIKAKK